MRKVLNEYEHQVLQNILSQFEGIVINDLGLKLDHMEQLLADLVRTVQHLKEQHAKLEQSTNPQNLAGSSH